MPSPAVEWGAVTTPKRTGPRTIVFFVHLDLRGTRVVSLQIAQAGARTKTVTEGQKVIAGLQPRAFSGSTEIPAATSRTTCRSVSRSRPARPRPPASAPSAAAPAAPCPGQAATPLRPSSAAAFSGCSAGVQGGAGSWRGAKRPSRGHPVRARARRHSVSAPHSRGAESTRGLRCLLPHRVGHIVAVASHVGQRAEEQAVRLQVDQVRVDPQPVAFCHLRSLARGLCRGAARGGGGGTAG